MEAIVATYRNGVLTPVKPLALPEGAQVTVWVDRGVTQYEQMTADDRAFFERLANEKGKVFERLAE